MSSVLGSKTPRGAVHGVDLQILNLAAGEGAGNATFRVLPNENRVQWRMDRFSVRGMDENDRPVVLAVDILIFVPPHGFPIQDPVIYDLTTLTECCDYSLIYKDLLYPKVAEAEDYEDRTSGRQFQTNEHGEMHLSAKDLGIKDNKKRREWRFLVIDLRPRKVGFVDTYKENKVAILFIPPFGSDEDGAVVTYDAWDTSRPGWAPLPKALT